MSNAENENETFELGEDGERRNSTKRLTTPVSMTRSIGGLRSLLSSLRSTHLPSRTLRSCSPLPRSAWRIMHAVESAVRMPTDDGLLA